MMYKVIVPARIERQIEDAVASIRRDSFQNAERFEQKLLSPLESLRSNPERFPPYKYKMNNDGSIRAFEVLHHRVSFFLDETQITIVRLRHTKRSPLFY